MQRSITRMAMQKHLLVLGLLAMCLALGVVIAAGVDAWNGDSESTESGIFAVGAAALLLASCGVPAC